MKHRVPSIPRAAVRALALSLLALLIGAAADAQMRAAGSGSELPPDRKEQLDKAIEEAPWHLGAVRLTPWIGIRDASLVSEVAPDGEQHEDLTATLGAGLRAYLPLGSRGVIAAHALPEYTWWQDQDERSTAVGRYGLGWFGFFNRLQTEVTARRTEEVDFLSSDVLVQEPFTTDEIAAQLQLRVVGSLALFASGTSTSHSVDPNSGLTTTDPSTLLDRTETDWRAGVRYLLRGDRGHIGAGVTGERTEFDAQTATNHRSNESTATWYIGTLVKGNHFDVAVDYVQRDLEPTADSTFPGYSAGTGDLLVNFRPGWRTSFRVFASRDLVYSALELDSFIEEERAGIGFQMQLGTGGVNLFYEQGTNDYFGTDSTSDESVEAYGGYLSFTLLRFLDLGVGARQTNFSPDFGAEREVREVYMTASLRFGNRGFGSPGDNW